MAKQYILYLNLISILVVVIFCLGSCSFQNKGEENLNDYHTILNYFEEKHGVSISNEITEIFVLTEVMCPICNKVFADFITKFINNETSVLVINARGTQVDIRPFLNNDDNVFFDPGLDNNKYEIFSNTKVVFLSDKSIDTIIIINTKNLYNQLILIDEHVKQ